jgi:Ran GTPase-activating protein (RanGAP) involved in mRNA processing and transport
MAFISRKVFSLQGKSLKLDSRSDIDPHLKNVDPTVIEEICLGGNTIGIEAAKALAEFLKKTTALKVCEGPIPGFFFEIDKANLDEERSRTLQISLLVDSSPKYPPRCPRSATLSKTRPHSSSST